MARRAPRARRRGRWPAAGRRGAAEPGMQEAALAPGISVDVRWPRRAAPGVHERERALRDGCAMSPRGDGGWWSGGGAGAAVFAEDGEHPCAEQVDAADKRADRVVVEDA